MEHIKLFNRLKVFGGDSFSIASVFYEGFDPLAINVKP